MRRLFLLLMMAVFAGTAPAAIKSHSVIYKDGDVTLEGFVAYDEAAAAKSQPGVLIVHQWTGLSEYEKGRALQLARMGYVAFACDIYGQGIRPSAPEASGKEAGKYKGDRKLFRQRLNAGLEELKKQAAVDPSRVAAIGYCFGGTGVIELARSGADFNAGVSFHGGLDSPTPADGKNIRAKLLICHGADDPFTKKEDVDAFQNELREAKVDWQMISYGNAVHSFTDKGADGSLPGAKYNKEADERSWKAMKTFFDETLAPTQTKKPSTPPGGVVSYPGAGFN
ncbi:dienelactone hydrolase family protein [Candidatus Sumerlaeota bacterium]|nr:dienelactone hydrolase family protein [Candidatus Sumerlaeota bacterium]